MKQIYTLLSLVFFSLGVFAQTPEMIKDINPAPFQDGVPVNLEKSFIEFKERVYFTGDDGTTGRELWATDGTEAGTVLVKDINEGEEDSNSQKFYVVGNHLFFVATDAEHGQELWRTDGTEAGTELVKDINPGTADGPWFSTTFTTDYFAWNDVLYFGANNGTAGVELWRSDGTEAGTYMLQDIEPGDANSTPRFFTVHEGKLYFNAGSLWETDGTEAGTELVNSIYPEYMVSNGDYLVFAGAGDFNNIELWRSDGTDSGTQLVKEINTNSPNGSSFVCGFPEQPSMAVIGNIAYFPAKDASGQTELWRTDGTEAGTYKVKDATSTEFNNCAKNLTVLNDILYYGFNNGIEGYELWRTDGTESGTYMVKDIIEGDNGSFEKVEPTQMITAGDRLIFAAGIDGASDLEVWTSDGTEEGTVSHSDFFGLLSDAPRHFTLLGEDKVIFAGAGQTGGTELWRMSLVASGIGETIQAGLSVQVAPTLTKEQFHIQVNDKISSTVFNVELLNMAGASVKNWEEVRSGQKLNVNGVANGTYFVRIFNGDIFITEKLIITN